MFQKLFRLSTDKTPISNITMDEERALRYAAGFVFFSLCKQLPDRPGFQQSLKALAVEGKPSNSVKNTTQWNDAVGTPFKMSNNA